MVLNVWHIARNLPYSAMWRTLLRLSSLFLTPSLCDCHAKPAHHCCLPACLNTFWSILLCWRCQSHCYNFPFHFICGVVSCNIIFTRQGCCSLSQPHQPHYPVSAPPGSCSVGSLCIPGCGCMAVVFLLCSYASPLCIYFMLSLSLKIIHCGVSQAVAALP